MWKAMIWKECRECAVLAGLGAVVMLVLTAGAVHHSFAFYNFGDTSIPFVFEGYSTFMFVVCTFGWLLGLQQTFWESKQKTWLFLLHRPMQRENIIQSKLLAGLAVYLLITVVPLLIYCFWAATPGTHASPFSWSYTERWWRVILGGVVFYEAGFFCGLRPGRWFGSRLIPLLGTNLLMATLQSLIESWVIPPWVGYVATILIAIVFYVQLLDQARAQEYS